MTRRLGAFAACMQTLRLLVALLVCAAAPSAAVAQAPPPPPVAPPADAPAPDDDQEDTAQEPARPPVVKETVDVQGTATPPLDAGVPAQFAVTAADLESLRGALLDDPLRALHAVPGVATTDELRADLSVRGSPFRQVGLVIDDVKSRLLMHTVRGVEQTGSVALLNGETVAGASLSAGSYPQRYGNSLGAELVVRTRDGRADRMHGRVMTSLIATTATLDGPVPGLRDRATWLVAARRSYASWVVTRVDPDLGGTFDFHDAFAKVRTRVGRAQTVSLTWLGGASEYDERGRRTAAYALDIGRNRTHLLTGAWQATPSPSWLVSQRVSYVSARFRNFSPVGRVLDDGREREMLSRTSLTWTRPRLSVDASVNVEGFAIDGEAVRFGGTRSGLAESFSGRTSRAGAHVHVQGQPHARVQIGAGLRVDDVEDTGSAAAPWAQLAIALSSQWRLQAAHGWYRQAPALLMRVGPNAGVGLTLERARHTDVGLAWQHGPWSASATAYLRRETDGLDVPWRFAYRTDTGALFPGDPRAPWLNVLTGDARGLEFSARRQSATWSGWLSYAWGRVEQQLWEDTPAFPSAFEQRHLFNAMATTRLATHWDGSVVLRLASNWPYEGYFERRDGRTFVTDVRNGLRLPTYARIDVRVRRHVPLGTRRLIVFAEALNLFNRRNLRQVEGSLRSTGEVVRIAEEQLPIVPSVGLAFEW